MSITLKELNTEDTGSELGIGSLTPPEAIRLGNELSNTNRSAFAALAAKKSGDETVSMYQLFKNSLDINADDQPVKNHLQDIEDGRRQRTLGISGDMLIDPNVPEGVKNTIPFYLQKRTTPDPRKIVAEQSLTEDNVVNGKLEGANQEAARMSSWIFGGENGVDANLQYKKEANKLVMAAAAQTDSSYVDMYFDLFAAIMPGTEALNTAAMRERFGAAFGEDPNKPQSTFLNIFTQFSNKREMREMINKLPPEKRMEALKQALNIIQDQRGPGVFDGNEFSYIENARELISDPEVFLSDQGEVGSVVTDTLFNMLSVIGLSPSRVGTSFKSLVSMAGGTAEKTIPKVIMEDVAEKGITAPVQPVVAQSVKRAEEKVLDVGGTHMTEVEIAEKRVQLSAQAENKFDKATLKQLTSEQSAIKKKIADLEEEKLVNKENASQLAKDMKTSRKEAIRKTNKVVDEQIEEEQVKLRGIKDKLKYSDRGYLAEVELSKFEQAIKGAKPVVAEAPKSDLKASIKAALDEASTRVVVGSAKPSSVVSMIAETNPSKASALVKASVEDETGELAKVVSGTSREELVNDAISPSPGVSPTVSIKPVLDVDKGTLDLAMSDSGLRYTDMEMKGISYLLKESVANARGATLSTPMSQLIEDSDHGFRIKGTFIDGNVGFNNAQDALERTRFALQNEGVDMDSLTLLRRTEAGYEPVEKGVDVTTLPLGDYAVQVDHNWNFQLVSGFEKFDVKWNWLDWAKGPFNSMVTSRQGTLTRHLFSPQHMFHKDLMLATTTSFDRAAGITKRLAKLADEFNKPFSKLSSKEQKELAEYIIKANTQRIPFHAPSMLGAGFTHDQVNVMSNWKRYWDTAYVLENADKVRTLQLTGWKMFLHKATNSELFAKPQGRNASVSGKVYDPDLDMIVDLSTAGKKHLYDNGGTVAVLRDHITDANGEVAKYVTVKNNVGSFTREFNENDRVLNYINGYYSVRHEAPLFVIQNVKDKSGRILYKKAIAEAGSLREAEEMAKAVAARTQGLTYARDGHDTADFFVRTDVKTGDALDLNNARFDVGISSGRSSQRFRGAPLESYDPLAAGQSQYVQNPLEAMQQTAFSLGNRLATRPLIEGWKARYMEQFSEFLTTDPDTHIKGFPTDPSDIGRNMIGSKKLTDARTMWEYINQMEHGYESALDTATRSLIGIIADGVSHLPVSPLGGKGEELLRKYADSGKVSSTVRSSVYLSSLVSAHVATFLMQSAQSLANLSLSFMDPHLYRDLSDMLGAALGIGTGKSLTRGKQLWKEWEKTGQNAAVNIHSAAFLGGSGSGSALGGVSASRGMKMARSVGTFIQGFYSKGELVNQYTAWLAKRLDFERVNGRAPSTARELEQVHAEGRLLTYNMNRSGQMAYNENTLNIQLQFFQVLHKALFDPLLSRGMSAKDRIRLGIAPLFIFGLPIGVRNEINAVVEGSGLSREEKEEARKGFEWSLIGTMLGAISPSLEELDYGKFNPLDPVGLADRLGTLVTWSETFTRTPGGGLIDRGLTALVTASRYLGITTADSGIEPNNEAMFRSLANLTAGTSNSFKGSLLVNEGLFRDKLGRTIVDDIDPVHAYAQWFGMTPKEVIQTYEFNKEYIETSKEFKEDVATVIKNIREQLALNGVLSGSPEYTHQAVAALFRVFGNNPKARDELMTQLSYDLHKNGQSSYLYTMMKASGHLDDEQQNAIGARIPDEKQRKAFFDLKDSLNRIGEK